MKKYAFLYRFLDPTTVKGAEPQVAPLIANLYIELLTLHANAKSLSEAISQQAGISGMSSGIRNDELLKEMLQSVEKDGEVCKGLREVHKLSHENLGVRC
jgi:hypothetical protein